MFAAEPLPKFLPATKMVPEYFGLFRTKLWLRAIFPVTPVAEQIFAKSFALNRLRNLAGMIWSVSTFSMGRGIAELIILWNLSIAIF